ncbi:murein biosynthesis integral membrane protein MurJ [Thioalkalivibrio sp. XN279]|uniref:murein biosynthesis integral membrane protein MurJ n=1 Tax=Thioalkalivibrio sp. XN279 TaxID=2714953 RepID=UPI001409E338|nr:murein biosynthesis integral membrane protein MurJ [Thioalkalivibrio sp. XN279]NHA14909.1 murein biosynthesis integral membrane protein MurJ [Thioalkalivibrio sp. XN279]
MSHARSTTVVGANTLASRVLGFARDVVFARLFGAGAGMDVFVVAFQIPNFLRRLFAEGAFSQAFVPVLSEYKAQRSHAEVKELADRVTGTLGVALFFITLVGVIASPLFIMLFAPGYLQEPEKLALGSEMLRLTFPYLFFISLTALAGGILNTYGRFGVPAFTPVFLNLVLIAAALWLAPMFERPIVGVAVGVLIAGVVQLAFQLPFLRALKLLPRPRWGWKHPGVRQIGRLMLPAILGSSVAQINLIVDRVIASFLVTGSISWLYYSDRLLEFPLGIFAIALATVILPGLSRRHAEKSMAEFSATLDWALKLVVVIALPAAVGLFMLAGPMLATLFQYGEFTPFDVRMASLSLMAYALALIGFTLVKVLSPGYFSRQDIKTPVRISIRAMLLNIVLNMLIVVPMYVYQVPGAHAGLAAATGLSAVYNATALYRGLRRAEVYAPGSGWAPLLARVLFANLVMGLGLWVLAGPLDAWLDAAWHERGLRLAGVIFLGLGAYLAALLLAGLRPRHLRSATGAPSPPHSV